VRRLLRAHVDRFANAGLADGTTEQAVYLAEHDNAVRWAQVNRAVIGQRMLEALGADGSVLLDAAHNTVTRVTFEDGPVWLHRKGATPADAGPVVVAGSRGTLSYLVQTGGQRSNDVAHTGPRRRPQMEAQ